MKKSKLLTLSFLSIAVLGISAGGVFAAWAVTDNADTFTTRVTVGDDNTATVTFMTYNGNIAYQEQVFKGAKLSNPPADPTLSGYVFNGWALDNTLYTKSNHDLSTQTYNNDTVYYPRFAKYGYKKNSGSAEGLSNDRESLINLSANDSLLLGTYIYGKSLLENGTNPVTISNAGNYALTFGNPGDSWSSSSATTVLDNWSIQRRYTLTATNEWVGREIYGRFLDSSSNVTNDYFANRVGETSTYYVFGDYDATTVEFGALYSDTTDHGVILDNHANVQYWLDQITLNGVTTSYTLPGKAYYLTGTFDGVNWGIDSDYILTIDSSDSNLYSISNVALTTSDLLKVRTNTNDEWITNVGWAAANFDVNSDGNISVKNDGIYNIKLHLYWGNDKIEFTSVAHKSTFTVTDAYLNTGDSIKAVIYDNDTNWNVLETVNLTGGSNNVYSGTSSNYLLTSGHPFRFVIVSSSATEDWDTLNPSGNRTVYGGTDVSYTYTPAAPTIACYVRGNATDNGDWDPHDEYGLVESSTSGIKYEISNIHLGVGNFKIADTNWGPIDLGYTALNTDYSSIGFGNGGDGNISCSYSGHYNIQVNDSDQIVITLVSYDDLQFTFSNSGQALAYQNDVKVFIYYQAGNDWAWKQVDAYTHQAPSVTVTLPSNTVKCLLARCTTSTTTPDWGITSGDGAGRIYNKTNDITITGGTTSYPSGVFNNYPS